jgi:hypothetical protein
MPIAVLFALVLSQATPSDTPSAPQTTGAAADAPAAGKDIASPADVSNLPKDDYGLVAWCHGALAGQLELDPIAHADMISIEGKAKVAARAKDDAQMEKDRREYLHEYERALAAAEKASPTAIHQYGVDSEVSGYKLWAVTRQKQPIWRMLDWGMWDPNDAGCGEAAKRLYNKSSLFGLALKGSGDDKTGGDKAGADKAGDSKAGDDEPVALSAPPPSSSEFTAGSPIIDSAAAKPATEPAPLIVGSPLAPSTPTQTQEPTSPTPLLTDPAPPAPTDTPLRGPQR